MRIEKIQGREILYSRGNPTIEVDVTLECGIRVELLYHQEPQQVKMKR